MMKKLVYVITALLMVFSASSQEREEITGTIRGKVIDKALGAPLPGATVVVINSQPLLGTTTDLNGQFEIENVPVGRQSIKVSFLGYSDAVKSQMNVITGKDLYLTVELEENITQMKEVVISARQDKATGQNEMATVSARTFSVEESQRFAGARNDVSRMAMNFAGVRGANDAVNDIVIRGNSSNALLWRYNGIDIPNPNHFGQFGGTGGPVSMLNNNVLQNSDFLTGAFPAAYGNAIGGVFDLRTRHGNNQKHEFLGQVGFNGFELGAEGPLSGNKKGSYLVNYRYSTLGLFHTLGINFGTGAAVPDYQDLTFNLNLPMENGGTLEFFGLAGISEISLLGSEIDTNDAESLYGEDNLDLYNRNRMAVIGASYKKLLSKKTLAKLTVAGTYFQNSNIVDTVNLVTRVPYEFAEQSLANQKVTAHGFLKTKWNAQQQTKIGLIFTQKGYDLSDKFLVAPNDWFDRAGEEGSTSLVQPYAEWQFRPTGNLTFNTGVHAQYLALNDAFSIEPRVGASYSLNEKNKLSVAYGLHSQMADLYTYFGKVEDENGTYRQPNVNLDFTKSHHFVVGHDLTLRKNRRFKTEVYYQHIFDAIVSEKPSSFSLLNQSTFQQGVPDSLRFFTNGGTGTNYGLELTFEQFMTNGFYFLTTLSLYDSKYTGSDGVERNSAFNSQYVLNGLAGKEFELFKNKEGRKSIDYLFIDGKVTLSGGQRYIPIDKEASAQAFEAVYDLDRAYEEQFKDYFRVDLNIGYKTIGKRLTQEWSINMQNITNRANPLFQRYNPVLNETRTVNQLGLFVVPQWRITF